jgi:hypothetical protein|tara:strand:+ start:782 stop:961 length:180 start_codon:yes stop_codon:yes gene_type:complete
MKREFTFTNVLKDAKSNTKHYEDRLLQNEDETMEKYYQSKFMEALQYQKGLIVAKELLT